MKKDVTGFVVEKGNASELYDAMGNLYCSKDLCDEMGRNALEYVSGSFEQNTLFEKIRQDRLELLKNSVSTQRAGDE
jgi:hypothetical protein